MIGDTGAKFLLVYSVSECEVVFRTKSSSVTMSTISNLILSVKVVSFYSLVLIISIVLGICVSEERHNIMGRENFNFM